MDFEKAYEKYCEKLNTHSSGLVNSDKSDFLKFCVFYDLMRSEEKKELKGRGTTKVRTI